MLKLILSIWFSMLSLVLRIAAKLRLTIPGAEKTDALAEEK